MSWKNDRPSPHEWSLRYLGLYRPADYLTDRHIRALLRRSRLPFTTSAAKASSAIFNHSVRIFSNGTFTLAYNYWHGADSPVAGIAVRNLSDPPNIERGITLALSRWAYQALRQEAENQEAENRDRDFKREYLCDFEPPSRLP